MIKPKDKPLEIYNLKAAIPILIGWAILGSIFVFGYLKASLYDMNNGPEKQIYIVAESDKLADLPINVTMHDSMPERHFGGGRTYMQMLYSDATAKTVTKEFYKAAQAKGWTSNGDNTFVKDKMSMSFRILPQAEYADIKHMKGKTAWKVVIHID